MEKTKKGKVADSKIARHVISKMMKNDARNFVEKNMHAAFRVTIFI